MHTLAGWFDVSLQMSAVIALAPSLMTVPVESLVVMSLKIWVQFLLVLPLVRMVVSGMRVERMYLLPKLTNGYAFWNSAE